MRVLCRDCNKVNVETEGGRCSNCWNQAVLSPDGSWIVAEEGGIEHFKITLTCSDPVDQSCMSVDKEFPTRKGMDSAQAEARDLVCNLKNLMGMDTDQIIIRKIYTGK